MEGLCRTTGIEFHEEMLQPYKDKDRKILSGVHKESKSMGDPNFHQYGAIMPDVANRLDATISEETLGEATLAVAAQLGYEAGSCQKQDSLDRPPPITEGPKARAYLIRDAMQQRRARLQNLRTRKPD